MINKYIIRNQEHFSRNIISLIYEKNKCLEVVKTSLDNSSRKGLENELIGYDWYCQHGGLIYPRIIKDDNSFLTIALPYTQGATKHPVYGYSVNKKYIKLIIEKYKKVWQSEVNSFNAALHGDFSIGNIIFNEEEIYFIDWEHFSIDGFPVGIDVLNLLFEQLWFEKRIFGIMKSTLNDISILLKGLSKDGYILCEDKSYLSYLISVLKKNKVHWDSQLEKMPVLKFSHTEVKSIDNYLSTS